MRGQFGPRQGVLIKNSQATAEIDHTADVSVARSKTACGDRPLTPLHRRRYSTCDQHTQLPIMGSGILRELCAGSTECASIRRAVSNFAALVADSRWVRDEIGSGNGAEPLRPRSAQDGRIGPSCVGKDML